jgi:hypothetical protein
MIIGNGFAYSDIYAALQPAERGLQRDINPTILSADEWRKKLSDENSFVRKVNRQPKIYVIGTEGEFKRIGQIWSPLIC